MVNWKLKQIISEKYGTQVDFANAIGTGESRVSNVVRGRKKLTQEEKVKWVKLLECSESEIFN